jgi:sugar phosphate isomerase/epimerase
MGRARVKESTVLKLGTYEAWFDGEVIVPGETLEDRLANLEAWGYQGIQLARGTLEMGWPAIQRTLSQSSIKLCIAGGGRGLLSAQETARKEAAEQIRQGLHVAAEMGAQGSIVVPIFGRPEIPPPAPPQTLYALEREVLIDGLAGIAPTAEELGVNIILEPLNRYETHFVNRLEQGADICQAVGSDAVKIMADFFHMNIEEIDIGQAIEQAADHIAYVHLADSNRYQPGAGHLDFEPGLAALKRIGYDGWMTLECRVMGEDKGKALVQSAQYIRGIWDAL